MGKPIIIEAENRVSCDVDDTLIRTGAFVPHEAVVLNEHRSGVFVFSKKDLIPHKATTLVAPYYTGFKIIEPKPAVEAFIRSLKLRGYHVTVHSNNGWQWAKAVVEALEMEDCVDLICTKSSKCLDDTPNVHEIIGSLIHPDSLK